MPPLRVFASHDWARGNHARVRIVVQELKRRNVDVWFDETHMKGNLLDAMCRGVDAADVVLVFVTANYLDKAASGCNQDNVRREFMYAQETLGASRLIAVRFEPIARKWWGPVGMILGSSLYVDMAADPVRTCAYDDLVAAIRAAGPRPAHRLERVLDRAALLRVATRASTPLRAAPPPPPAAATKRAGAPAKRADPMLTTPRKLPLRAAPDVATRKASPYTVLTSPDPSPRRARPAAAPGAAEEGGSARPSVRERVQRVKRELDIDCGHMADDVARALSTLRLRAAPGASVQDRLALIEEELGLA